jgi:hypothetical protein
MVFLLLAVYNVYILYDIYAECYTVLAVMEKLKLLIEKEW